MPLTKKLDFSLPFCHPLAWFGSTRCREDFLARRVSRELRDKDIQGAKYLKAFNRVLRTIRSCAKELHSPGRKKRQFVMEHYVGLLLLYFYTPLLTSLRSLQRASLLKKVQRMLGCKSVPLGSLSEAASVFDPEVLRRVIKELARELRVNNLKVPKELVGLTAVDGSFLRAVPRMTWALWRRDDKNRGVKMHLVFDVMKEAPSNVSLTHANASEKQELRRMLESGRFYVIDAGYAQYSLFADIIAAGSSFVCRIRDDAVWKLVEERPLSEEAIRAGVQRDLVVRLGCWDTASALDRPVRVVKFLPPRTRENKEPEVMLLATDRLDLAADLITLAYRFRWSVELFFRWFKCILGCRQLLSHSESGVMFQVYLGVIASLLISLWTGRKPNKATLEMIWFYMAGLADEEEFLAHLQQLSRNNQE
jgi:hypothetical protein